MLFSFRLKDRKDSSNSDMFKSFLCLYLCPGQSIGDHFEEASAQLEHVCHIHYDVKVGLGDHRFIFFKARRTPVIT